MIIILYLLAVIVSFLIIVLLGRRGQRQNIVYIAAFISCFIANLGYFIISTSETVEGAFFGNFFTYVGGLFMLYFMFKAIVNICHIKGQWITDLIFICLNIIIIVFVYTSKYNHLYYKNFDIAQLNGVTYIIKDYGPMHILYNVYLVVYFIYVAFVTLHSLLKQKNTSLILASSIIAILFINIFSHILKLVFGFKFEILPLTYAISEIILLYIITLNEEFSAERGVEGISASEKIGIILFDKQLHFKAINNAALDFFPEFKELKFDNPINNSNAFLKENLSNQLVKYIKDPNQNTFHINKKGSSYKFNIKNFGASTGTKQIGYSVEIIDDTISRAYELALQSAVEDAQAANTAKTDFLRRMSHDIRTPINGIMGMLDIANKNFDDKERVQDCLTKIKTSSSFLLSLVNDVLDMNKLESGIIELPQEPMDVREIVNDCIDIISPQLAERGITLEVKRTESKFTHVISSPLHFRQILLNILSNSYKYNKPNGSIRFSSEQISKEKDKVTFKFIIEDTGIGMSEDFVKKLFEPFQQENETARSQYGGTGLGLSIVKKIIEKMNGEIEVTSKKGIGSKFIIRLPFTIDSSFKPKTYVKETKEADLNGMQVLLVEDNDLNMEIATYLLEEKGIKITQAKNGQEAVDIFEKSETNYFEAVLMDIMMPVLNGYEATKAIRELDRKDAKKVPIIAMTANAFAEDVNASKEAGMNAHIAKPLDAKIVFKVLSKYRNK